VLKGRLLPSAQSSALSPHGLIPTTNARRLMPSNRAVGLPPSSPPLHSEPKALTAVTISTGAILPYDEHLGRYSAARLGGA